ncbi:MAG: hypothetical protein GY929_15975 [Actinomycetia bacterium]|nr:hypothetical protein [Actinomycetes bacterium]
MLELEGEIPQLVHVSWKNEGVLGSNYPIVLNGIATIVRLNPDWQLQIHDDADVEQYLETHLSTEDYRHLNGKHIVEKVDLWRLLKIYNEGGMYTDVDRHCNISMREVMSEGIRCILPMQMDINFCHDVMISVPYNPIFKTAIELNLVRRKQGYGIFELGPDTYFDAVCIHLLGEQIGCPPSTHHLTRLREIIRRAPDLDTFREGGSKGTLLHRVHGEAWRAGNGGSTGEFYDSEGVEHWAGRHAK